MKGLQDYRLEFIWASCLMGVKAFEQFFNALGTDLNFRHFRVWAWFKWGIHTGTRFDVYETLCPQQMLVHKGSQIKNWSGECRDVIPTKLQCQTIQRALQSPNLQREIIRKK